MANYDYDLVIGWLETLQSLDSRAHHHAFLAGNYFSLSQNEEHVRRVAAFLANDAALNPEDKWPWMVRAVEIAASRLKDDSYALALSQRLAAFNLSSIPFNVLILPAIFLERLERYQEARLVLEHVVANRSEPLAEDDQKWVESFLLRLP
jgi:hypothetical protein